MTADLGPDDKAMKLRYAGTCRLCGQALDAGAAAVYERATRTVRCVECMSALEPESGTAGASARREFERRKSQREERIRESHPKLGGLILALSDDPHSTRAWERGAVGEELLAQRLAELPDTFRVLHDRRIPGTLANIDHIAVGPTGVWVIDAKRYKGKRPELRVEGGIVRPRVESLRIGGRNGTKLVDGALAQVSRVRAVIRDDSVPLGAALCFLEADWPLLGGSFSVNGVHVTWPRGLLKLITQSPASPMNVEKVSSTLATEFPIA